MPTYEYECKKCSHNFEAFQAMSDEPLKKCPKCGKELRRLIFGGAGVIFKGSGFYVNDKAAGKGRGAPAESAASSSDSKQGESPQTPAPQSPCAACEKCDAGKAAADAGRHKKAKQSA
jgi:putative FmdB family regulatory protein